MSQVLDLGSAMGFSKFDTKDFLQKSPLAGNVCASPMSQMSTAPCTPSLGLMPDPEMPPCRQLSEVSALDQFTIPEEDDGEILRCVGKSPLLSGLATWAQQQVEGKSGPPDFMLDMPQMQSDLGRWADLLAEAEYNVKIGEQDLNVVSFGLQPLESELGRQMERLIKAEDWYNNKLQEKFIVESSCLQAAWKMQQDLRVISFGMPPLESELGRQMERLIKAKDWYNNELQEKFIVESSCLQAAWKSRAISVSPSPL